MIVPAQVLIVGAGPTGLALACHLLRLDVRVRIIDKKAEFSTTSKTIGLQYRVSEILACMGIVDRFLAVGGSPTVVNIHAGERRLVQLKFDASGTPSGRDAFKSQSIVIPQSQTGTCRFLRIFASFQTEPDRRRNDSASPGIIPSRFKIAS